jgi:hypothetical protein
MRNTVYYSKVKHTAKRRVTCNVCGKHLNRQRTFEQTVNPWNKNPDGTVKTFMQVLASVHAEALVWEPDPYCGAHQEMPS